MGGKEPYATDENYCWHGLEGEWKTPGEGSTSKGTPAPRWLIEKGREGQGRSVLARLHLNRTATNNHLLEHDSGRNHTPQTRIIAGTAWKESGKRQEKAPPRRVHLSWRFPLSFQAVPAIILVCGVWFLPESPRWLIEKARLSLIWKSSCSSRWLLVAVRLRWSRARTERPCPIRSWRHLILSPRWRHRILLACGLQVFTQCAGTSVHKDRVPELR
jgi:hypothetical protein